MKKVLQADPVLLREFSKFLNILPNQLSHSESMHEFIDKKDDYRKVASTNASRFVTRLVFKHTQNDNFLI